MSGNLFNINHFIKFVPIVLLSLFLLINLNVCSEHNYRTIPIHASNEFLLQNTVHQSVYITYVLQLLLFHFKQFSAWILSRLIFFQLIQCCMNFKPTKFRVNWSSTTATQA